MSDPPDGLWRGFDAVGFDLDGVIYRGPDPVPGAPEAINEMHRQGARIGFVTNNAQRPPQVVADQLRQFGIDCGADDIVTSAQATARLMAQSLPQKSEVLIVGSPALADEVANVGLTPVAHRSPDTAALIVGYYEKLTWEQLNQACYAIQHGAAYYACNDDLTRPTEQGLAIGMGAVLVAIAQPLPNNRPIIGGKPARPLLDETQRRLGCTHPLFVGDRLDTDIEGAFNAGWASLFVLSGGHGPSDLVAAPPHQRPDFLAADVAGLLQPPRVASPDGSAWRCGDAVAAAVFVSEADPTPQTGVGRFIVQIEGPLENTEQRLDALWAAANAAWEWLDRDATVDATRALDRIGSFTPGVAG